MSRASCEPGDWKYQAMACALVAAPSAARPASAGRSFDPLMFFFPDLGTESLFQLGGEPRPRFFVEMPSDPQRLPRAAQHHVRALHFDPRRLSIDLVARDPLGLGHLDA